MQSNILSIITNMNVIVFADGQSDFPGHSTKYLLFYADRCLGGLHCTLGVP